MLESLILLLGHDTVAHFSHQVLNWFFSPLLTSVCGFCHHLGTLLLTSKTGFVVGPHLISFVFSKRENLCEVLICFILFQ